MFKLSSTHAIRQCRNIILIVTTITTLSGCGGGAPANESAVSLQSFPLAQAYDNYITSSLSETGISNLVLGNLHYSGSISLSKSGLTPASLNGQNVLKNSISLTGNFSYESNSVPYSSVSTTYFDSNFKQLAYSNPSSYFSFYCEISSDSPFFPENVVVGSSGTVSTSVCYSDYSKSNILSYATETYDILPGTTSSVIVEITDSWTLNGNTLASSIGKFNLNTSGLSLISASSQGMFQNEAFTMDIAF